MNRALFCISIAVVLAFAAACGSVPTGPDSSLVAQGHYKLGLAYLYENQLQPAFLEFQKAVTYDPEDKASWNLLGVLNTRFGQYEEAERAYKKALQVDNDYPDAYNNLGVLYNHQERWDEAIAAFETALRNPLYETPQKALSNLGYAQYRNGDLLAAQQSLNSALLRGSVPSAHYYLALVYLDLGRERDAVEELRQTVQEDPGHVEAHWRLAQYYLDTNETEAATPHLEAVVLKIPNDERGRAARRYLNLIEEAPSREDSVPQTPARKGR